MNFTIYKFFLDCSFKTFAPENNFKCLIIYICYLCNLVSLKGMIAKLKVEELIKNRARSLF